MKKLKKRIKEIDLLDISLKGLFGFFFMMAWVLGCFADSDSLIFPILVVVCFFLSCICYFIWSYFYSEEDV